MALQMTDARERLAAFSALLSWGSANRTARIEFLLHRERFTADSADDRLN